MFFVLSQVVGRNKAVYSTDRGEYWRLLPNGGTYQIRALAEGKASDFVNVTAALETNDHHATRVDLTLKPAASGTFELPTFFDPDETDFLASENEINSSDVNSQQQSSSSATNPSSLSQSVCLYVPAIVCSGLSFLMSG